MHGPVLSLLLTLRDWDKACLQRSCHSETWVSFLRATSREADGGAAVLLPSGHTLREPWHHGGASGC